MEFNSSQNNLKIPKPKPNWPKAKSSLTGRFGFFKYYPKVLKKKESALLLLMIVILVGSAIFWGIRNYITTTEVVAKEGGNYTEAVIGQPKLVNPILCQTNDADMDVSSLVFSGLMRVNASQELVTDVAESYTVSEDGKVYTFHIRQDVTFHDGEQLTAEDVVFTIRAIQNPDFNSPLRLNWQGVQISQIDEYTVNFGLPEPFAPFIDNATFGILPQHLWDTVTPRNASLAELNLQPIGSGPFAFDRYYKSREGEINRFRLKANEDFYRQRPYLDSFEFRFYPDDATALAAFSDGDVQGVGLITPEQSLAAADTKNLVVHDLNMPRYFAVFFNYKKNDLLRSFDIRKALAFAVNKQAILEQALAGEGAIVDTPIPQGFFGHNAEVENYPLNPTLAGQLLDAAGWKDGNGDGVRENGDQLLEITLTTTDLPEQIRVAEVLQSQWQEIGFKININTVDVTRIQQDHIRSRDYEALLFGENLSHDPDPYSFWHSSQREDPGLNLTSFRNQNIDDWLAEARGLTDQALRETKYMEFQDVIAKEIYAIFVYSPLYMYGQTAKMHGFTLHNIVRPSDRFSDVDQWYLHTKRVKIKEADTIEEVPTESAPVEGEIPAPAPVETPPVEETPPAEPAPEPAPEEIPAQ